MTAPAGASGRASTPQGSRAQSASQRLRSSCGPRALAPPIPGPPSRSSERRPTVPSSTGRSSSRTAGLRPSTLKTLVARTRRRSTLKAGPGPPPSTCPSPPWHASAPVAGTPIVRLTRLAVLHRDLLELPLGRSLEDPRRRRGGVRAAEVSQRAQRGFSAMKWPSSGADRPSPRRLFGLDSPRETPTAVFRCALVQHRVCVRR